MKRCCDLNETKTIRERQYIPPKSEENENFIYLFLQTSKKKDFAESEIRNNVAKISWFIFIGTYSAIKRVFPIYVVSQENPLLPLCALYSYIETKMYSPISYFYVYDIIAGI